MLIRKRGGGGGGRRGARVGLYYQGLQRWTPFKKPFYIESDTHYRKSQSSKVLFSLEKKYCSVFTDLTQDVSNFTGI